MKAPDWLQNSWNDNDDHISVFYTCYCEYLHFIALLHSGIKIVHFRNSIDILESFGIKSDSLICFQSSPGTIVTWHWGYKQII